MTSQQVHRGKTPLVLLQKGHTMPLGNHMLEDGGCPDPLRLLGTRWR